MAANDILTSIRYSPYTGEREAVMNPEDTRGQCPCVKEVRMSIRMIARDLYRLHQEVESLEKRLAEAPFGQQKKLREQLRKATLERNRIRSALDGGKDAPTYPLKPHR